MTEPRPLLQRVTREGSAFWIAVASALVAFLGTFLTGSWDVLLHEPGMLLFALVLSGFHALPFFLLAGFVRDVQRQGRSAVVVCLIAFVAEVSLMSWAYSILDTDDMAALVYIVVTPPATWAIAGTCALIVAFTSRRRPSRRTTVRIAIVMVVLAVAAAGLLVLGWALSPSPECDGFQTPKSELASPEECGVA